jgi:hypothetical protein
MHDNTYSLHAQLGPESMHVQAVAFELGVGVRACVFDG